MHNCAARVASGEFESLRGRVSIIFIGEVPPWVDNTLLYRRNKDSSRNYDIKIFLTKIHLLLFRYCETASCTSHLLIHETNTFFARCTSGIWQTTKKCVLSDFWTETKLQTDPFIAILTNFALTWAFWPRHGQKDAFANSRGLLSAIFRRVFFDT